MANLSATAKSSPPSMAHIPGSDHIHDIPNSPAIGADGKLLMSGGITSRVGTPDRELTVEEVEELFEALEVGGATTPAETARKATTPVAALKGTSPNPTPKPTLKSPIPCTPDIIVQTPSKHSTSRQHVTCTPKGSQHSEVHAATMPAVPLAAVITPLPPSVSVTPATTSPFNGSKQATRKSAPVLVRRSPVATPSTPPSTIHPPSPVHSRQTTSPYHAPTVKTGSSSSTPSRKMASTVSAKERQEAAATSAKQEANLKLQIALSRRAAAEFPMLGTTPDAAGLEKQIADVEVQIALLRRAAAELQMRDAFPEGDAALAAGKGSRSGMFVSSPRSRSGGGQVATKGLGSPFQSPPTTRTPKRAETSDATMRTPHGPRTPQRVGTNDATIYAPAASDLNNTYAPAFRWHSPPRKHPFPPEFRKQRGTFPDFLDVPATPRFATPPPLPHPPTSASRAPALTPPPQTPRSVARQPSEEIRSQRSAREAQVEVSRETASPVTLPGGGVFPSHVSLTIPTPKGGVRVDLRYPPLPSSRGSSVAGTPKRPVSLPYPPLPSSRGSTSSPFHSP
jgi:hypothetical protein